MWARNGMLPAALENFPLKTAMKIPLVLAALLALLPSGLRADNAVATTKSELLKADNQFCVRAAKVGILQAFLDVSTAETRILPEPGKGPEAIRSGFKDTPITATLTWKPSQADVSTSGDLGYTWGRYEYRDRAADGRSVVETGSYVTIWRRQADGSWKVVLDGGTPDPKS
jgi:ketosteroid isomerase-like protein